MKLHDHWAQALVDDYMKDLQKSMESYKECKEALRSIQKEVDLKALENASVVGMTTNGVALHQELMTELQPKVSMYNLKLRSLSKALCPICNLQI